ncbi:MAG: hypothetical protein LUH82_07425 [Clostridiales bacterium]|nr:hypothetical protein [Clostridiales bacterium]
MKENINSDIFKTCPKCGNEYHGVGAISRVDNKTLICPDCSTREALESIGVNSTEQEQILDTIHRCMEGQ